MRTIFLTLLLVAFCNCFADLKFRMRTTEERGPNRDRVVYVRGHRIRTEVPETGRVSIRQCDLDRTVQLDPSAKTYRMFPILPRPAVPAPQTVSTAEPQSCPMSTRREVEETGEVKQLFSMQAQHIRIFIYKDPLPESCPNHTRVASSLVQQRDGWYVEVPPIPECPARSEGDRVGLWSFDAPDRYVRRDGTMTPELLPAKVEVKVPRGQELETEFTAEVTELSTDLLDAALFEIPPGYRQAPGPDCAHADPIVAKLEDGTPVYLVECGVAPPRVIYQTEPEYSEHARKKKISGTVVMSLIVDTSGGIRDVKVERSLEPSLDQAAIEAASKWRFMPARRDEQPVAVKLSVEMSFNLY